MLNKNKRTKKRHLIRKFEESQEIGKTAQQKFQEKRSKIKNIKKDETFVSVPIEGIWGSSGNF